MFLCLCFPLLLLIAIKQLQPHLHSFKGMIYSFLTLYNANVAFSDHFIAAQPQIMHAAKLLE